MNTEVFLNSAQCSQSLFWLCYGSAGLELSHSYAWSWTVLIGRLVFQLNLRPVLSRWTCPAVTGLDLLPDLQFDFTAKLPDDIDSSLNVSMISKPVFFTSFGCSGMSASILEGVILGFLSLRKLLVLAAP